MEIKKNLKKSLYWILKGILYFLALLIILLISAHIAHFISIILIILHIKIIEKFFKNTLEEFKNSLASIYPIDSVFFLNMLFVLPLAINLSMIVFGIFYENIYLQYFDPHRSSEDSFYTFCENIQKINKYLLSSPYKCIDNKYNYIIKKIFNFIFKDLRKQFLRITIYLFILLLLCSLEKSSFLIISSILITLLIVSIYWKIKTYVCKKYSLENQDDLFFIKGSKEKWGKSTLGKQSLREKIIDNDHYDFLKGFLDKILPKKVCQIEKNIIGICAFVLTISLMHFCKNLEIFKDIKDINNFVNFLVSFEEKFLQKIFVEVEMPSFINQNLLNVINYTIISLCLFFIVKSLMQKINLKPEKASDFIYDSLIKFENIFQNI